MNRKRKLENSFHYNLQIAVVGRFLDAYEWKLFRVGLENVEMKHEFIVSLQVLFPQIRRNSAYNAIKTVMCNVFVTWWTVCYSSNQVPT